MSSERTHRTSERYPGQARLGRGCWIDSESVDDLAARCRAVIESSAPGSVVVGTTAARLHGLWMPDRDEPIQVATVSSGQPSRTLTCSRRSEFGAHRRCLPDSELAAVDGVPVTGLERTWRDLAGRVGLPDLVAAGDSALRAGADPAVLAELLRRDAGTRHIVRARQAFELLDARSRSRPESHLRVALAGPGLPTFDVNEVVRRQDGGWLAEPDLSLPSAKIALEYQGEEHGTVSRMRRDITRSTDLRREGWLVYFYGPAEVFRRPWLIESDVRSAIRARRSQRVTFAE